MEEHDPFSDKPAGQHDPVEVPADWKSKGLVEVLRGKDYINHKGIVKLLHMHGVMCITTSPVLELCSMADGYFTFKCEIVGSRCSVTMYADASPDNVSRNIVSAVSRMAETRAVNRAGRTYLGLGQTTFDEMPGGDEPQRPGRVPSKIVEPVSSDKFGGSQSQFFRELDVMKMDYETVKHMTLSKWKAKPSEMSKESLEQIVLWLKTDKGLAEYSACLASMTGGQNE
tara:strand:- start:491 stop:1171 length:681 start_codon:yes stop_codon:yes gene_type:complete